MKLLAWLAAVVLVGTVTYAFIVHAARMAEPFAGDMWFVQTDSDEAHGSVTLSRGDFDAIVRAYNLQNAELRMLRRSVCQ